MVGDKEWKEGLYHRYQENVSAAVRRGHQPETFEAWASEETWKDFTRLARLVLVLPDFALMDWATTNPIPAVPRHRGGQSINLARRLLSGLVMVDALLDDMAEWNRVAAASVRNYLRGHGNWVLDHLKEAKPWVYEWLLAEVERYEEG